MVCCVLVNAPRGSSAHRICVPGNCAAAAEPHPGGRFNTTRAPSICDPRAGSKPAPAAVRPPSGRGRPKERPRGDGVAPPSFFLLLPHFCYLITFSNSSGKRQAAHTRLLLAHSGDQTGLPLVSYGVSMVVCDGYHQCLVVNHLPRSSCAFVGCVAAAAPICFICFIVFPGSLHPPQQN